MGSLSNKVLPLIISDGGKFVEFFMIFKNCAIQSRAIRFISENGFRIVHMETFRDNDGKIVVKGIAEISSAKISTSGMKAALMNIEDVLDVKIRMIPYDGVAFFLSFYPPIMADIPLIIFRAKHFSNMINAIKEKWRSAGEAAVYYIGEMAGYESYDTLSRLFKEEGWKLAEIALSLSKCYGWWSRAEMINLNAQNGSIIIRIHDSIECRYVSTQRPNGQYVRGYLTGFFSKLLNSKVEAKEQFCLAKGDPYCEYHLTLLK